MRVAMCALVAALVLGAGSASAGGNKGDVEIGGYAGYGWLDEYRPVFPKDHLMYGGRLGVFLSRHWSFEVSAQRIASERDTIGDSKVNLDALRGNLLFNFDAEGMVRPFLTVGVGSEKFDPEDLGMFESKDLGWNVGGGLRLFPNDHVCLRLDGRYVMVHNDAFDENENDVEANAGLSFLFGGHHRNGEESSELESAAPPNGAPTVSCSADHDEILPGATATITATASDPDGDPLTYEWTTSAGHVVGTGNSVTLDFTGATGPTSSSVTVRVSDGHGHTATCSSDVRLAAAPPPPTPEAISCLAGGFPRNAARLTNVDKACLDDVVQRLRSDPRAHVVVIGYSDSHETSRLVAQQRADAVKDYCVAAGIETARITTRSGGSSHPAATGTDMASLAQNRRVMVWFVPEGAQEPADQ